MLWLVRNFVPLQKEKQPGNWAMLVADKLWLVRNFVPLQKEKQPLGANKLSTGCCD